MYLSFREIKSLARGHMRFLFPLVKLALLASLEELLALPLLPLSTFELVRCQATNASLNSVVNLAKYKTALYCGQ